MTEEELEKEAEEESYKQTSIDMISRPIYARGYLAGARSRELQIVELEEENARLKLLIETEQKIGNGEFWKSVWACKRQVKDLNDRLTKTKELLKETLCYLDLTDCVNNDPRLILYNDIEQFISEVEK